MYCWRVTKYNPQYRNVKGAYLKDEWTSYFDIGKEYDGVQLTLDQYLEWENRYLEAVRVVIEASHAKFLKIEMVEKYFDNGTSVLNASEREFFELLSDKKQVSTENVNLLVRLILRDVVWCKLSYEDMFVHFGYDYYMYIGSSKPLEKEMRYIESIGLFVESIESSPYS